MTDTILLTVPAGFRGAGVIALVLGGLGSRLELPIDRIDELTLAADIVSDGVLGGEVKLEATVTESALRLRIGPVEDGALAGDARRRVLEPLVDRVAVVRSAGHEYLELEVARGARG